MYSVGEGKCVTECPQPYLIYDAATEQYVCSGECKTTECMEELSGNYGGYYQCIDMTHTNFTRGRMSGACIEDCPAHNISADGQIRYCENVATKPHCQTVTYEKITLDGVHEFEGWLCSLSAVCPASMLTHPVEKYKCVWQCPDNYKFMTYDKASCAQQCSSKIFTIGKKNDTSPQVLMCFDGSVGSSACPKTEPNDFVAKGYQKCIKNCAKLEDVDPSTACVSGCSKFYELRQDGDIIYGKCIAKCSFPKGLELDIQYANSFTKCVDTC